MTAFLHDCVLEEGGQSASECRLASRLVQLPLSQICGLSRCFAAAGCMCLLLVQAAHIPPAAFFTPMMTLVAVPNSG